MRDKGHRSCDDDHEVNMCIDKVYGNILAIADQPAGRLRVAEGAWRRNRGQKNCFLVCRPAVTI